MLWVPLTAVGPEVYRRPGLLWGLLAMEEEGILNNQENASSSEVPSLTVPPREKGTVLKVGGPEMGSGVRQWTQAGLTRKGSRHPTAWNS